MRRTLIGFFLFTLAALAQISTSSSFWRVVKVGALADRPTTCQARRDVYVCIGTGCTNGANLHYCTTANNWTAQGGAASAGVNTFNSRNGDVAPAPGDYTAAQVTNTPAGAIAAITVQNALNELDTEKVGTSDARLSDARTPASHASSHGTVGSDPVSPASIGA